MKALVLCAGLGTRLRPLTDHLPKPLVAVCGKPCVEYTLEWLARQGVTEVAINTHYLPELLREHLGDGARWGLRLTWQQEETLLDGMGTLKSFDWFFGDEPALVVNGDCLLDLPLAPILATHQRLRAVLTLGTVAHMGPLFSYVAWDEDGRLRGARRTGLTDPRGRFVGEFSGVHVVEPVIWREWIPAGRRYHLTHELIPRLLAAEAPIGCRLVEGWWATIGDRESLARAEAVVQRGPL